MGYKLYNEVFDHAPADLTPKEMIAALAFAEDANDGTRMIWKGIEDPHFLRRIRVKRARLYELVDGLVKKGVLDLVSAGHRHGRAKYRFAKPATAQRPEDPDTEAGHPENLDTDTEFSVRNAQTLNHDQCPEDPDVSVRKTRTPTTPNHLSKNTTQEQPPPPAATAPPEWFPAESEGVVVQEEGEDGTGAAAERTPARKVVDSVADEMMKQAKLFVDKLPHDRQPTKLEHAELAHFASQWLAEGWSDNALMAKCVTGLDKMDNRVSVWRYRLHPDRVIEQPAGLIPSQHSSDRTEPCREGECDGHEHPKCERGWITVSNGLAHCPCSPMSKPRAAANGHQTYQDPDGSGYRPPKQHIGWQNPTDPNAYDGEF